MIISKQCLGTGGDWWLVNDATDEVIGRWDTHGDAYAHQGEHQAMDPEASLTVAHADDIL